MCKYKTKNKKLYVGEIMIKDIEDKFSLTFVRKEDKELLKIYYKWQISEDEKNKMSCAWIPEKHSEEFKEENYEKFYNRMQNRLYSEINYAFLKEKKSGKYLDFISYQEQNMRNRSIEMSYYFPKENRKKGYGKILLSLFLDKMFNYQKLNLNKIYAETYEANIGSVKLLNHFGFQIDGRMREHYWFENGKVKYDQLIFSLLRSDWEKKIV